MSLINLPVLIVTITKQYARDHLSPEARRESGGSAKNRRKNTTRRATYRSRSTCLHV